MKRLPCVVISPECIFLQEQGILFTSQELHTAPGEMSSKMKWEIIMKVTDKEKPVKTIPNGVWESSRPAQNSTQKEKDTSITTDFQGNGYPSQKQSK